MSDHGSTPSPSLNRRDFVRTGAIAGAAAVTLSTGSQAAPPPASKPTLPRRPLGKTGVDVTMLNLGTWMSPGTARLLRLAYEKGIRTFDTADCYGSEPAISEWLTANPEVRKDIFLVTKDHPKQGHRQLIAQLDKRLEALKTDYVDLLFIHGIGPGEYGQASLEWPKSKEFKDTIEAIKKSGKARFVGFSCHDAKRAEYLAAAAEGGFVDAIMVQYTAWLEKDAPLNKALDACHKAGIGLISMKQVAGQTMPANYLEHMPNLKEKGLKPYQGLLHAIWSDERISTSCVSMRNTDQIRENVAALEKFEPMGRAEILELRDAFLAAGPTLCADCDGRCSRAGGTDAPLGDLTRLLTYHDHHGYRGEARRQYAELSAEQRAWQGADLDAARAACPNSLNFAKILPRVDEMLS